MFGNAGCIVFENYLGLNKNCVRSGNKPLQQVARYEYHQNRMYSFITNRSSSFSKSQKTPASEMGSSQLAVDKIKLPNSTCMLKTDSQADSTILYKFEIYKVVSIVQSSGTVLLHARVYCRTEQLFGFPTSSTQIGIYKVSELSDGVVTIELSSLIKKCLLVPYRSKFVAIELLH